MTVQGAREREREDSVQSPIARVDNICSRQIRALVFSSELFSVFLMTARLIDVLIFFLTL